MALNSKTKQNLYQNFLAVAAGGLVPLCLAPYNLAILAFTSSLLLIYSLEHCTPKQALTRGYYYGLALFGIGVSWIYISIHEHGNASPLLAGMLTLMLVLVLAFFPAAKTALYVWLVNKRCKTQFLQQTTVSTFINLAIIWTIIDWVQAWIFTGFPWLYLGYSQLATPLAGFAPILSVFGVTTLVVFCSGLLYLITKNLISFTKNNNNQYNLNHCLNYLLLLIIIFVLGASLKGVSWTTQQANPEKVVLVQGNIPQVNRWDPELYTKNIHTYETLTEPYWSNSTIIWPESSVSLPLPYSQELITKLNNSALTHNSTFIVGIPRLANKQQQFFNSIIALGKGSGSHNKNKLVPWGEYVPFESLLRGAIAFFNLPMSNFISGDVMTPHFGTLQSTNIRWLPFICYEIAYPTYVINHAQLGDAILTISNDAWFGNSIGPWQHLQLAQMRALETARPVIRATNNGITAIINPEGQIVQQIPQFSEGVLVDNTVYGFTGMTPVMYYGVNAVILLFFIILFAFNHRCYQPWFVRKLQLQKDRL